MKEHVVIPSLMVFIVFSSLTVKSPPAHSPKNNEIIIIISHSYHYYYYNYYYSPLQSRPQHTRIYKTSHSSSCGR